MWTEAELYREWRSCYDGEEMLSNKINKGCRKNGSQFVEKYCNVY